MSLCLKIILLLILGNILFFNTDTYFKLLSKYSNEEINLRPNLKKWSIGENLYHLWLTETSTEKYNCIALG